MTLYTVEVHFTGQNNLRFDKEMESSEVQGFITTFFRHDVYTHKNPQNDQHISFPLSSVTVLNVYEKPPAPSESASEDVLQSPPGSSDAS